MKRIAITGATGQIAYSLLFHLAHGDAFGPREPLALYLYDLPGTERAMEGLVMEIEDCAFPLVKEIRFGSDLHKMFEGIDLALLVGAKPRTKGMERSDLLVENGKIFVEQGRALNEVASRDARVIVVGNPCNTNCLIAMHNAPSIPRENFHAMMRLDQNRALASIAKKAGVGVEQVTRMTIWGNHSSTQVPDFIHAQIRRRPLMEVIKDKEWLQGEFIETIQKRGAAIIEARGKSSAASAANALIDAIKSLHTPTAEDDWFSTAICSDGNSYGLEEDLIFGFPCRSKGNGEYEVVPHLEWDYFIKEKMAATQKELIAERDCVKSLLKGK